MTSALATLLAGMSSLQAKRLSLASEDTALANAQATTKTEFDFDGNTWVNDAAVTVGTGTANPEFTWGSAAISDVDGYVAMSGGGHTDSGRNAIMALDVQAAAANINGGGSGVTWTRKQRGCRYILGANTRPSSGTSPTAAQQISPDQTGASGPDFWTMLSLDGVAMPVCVHPWHTFKFGPGTGKAFFSGGSGFADNTAASNAGFVWDRATNTMAGPLVAVGGAPAHCTTSFGYVGGTPNVSSLAISILNGRIYTINNVGNFAWKLTYWTNPTNSSLVLNDTGVFDPSLAPFDNADAIIIPDPADATKEIYFQHGGPQGSGTDANFLAISDINGSPVFNWQSYSGSNPTTGGPVWNHYAWDSKRKIIWMIDGLNLYQITPSALGLTHWTISAALTLTGDSFTDPAGSGSIIPSIQYVAADDAIIVSTLANTLVVRPPSWAIPGPFPWQYWGLDAWSLVASTPLALTALVQMQAKAAVQPTLKSALAVHATASSRARAQMLGTVGITALARMQAKARPATTFPAVLSAKAAAQSAAHATGSFAAVLAAKATAASEARAAATVATALTAKATAISQARATGTWTAVLAAKTAAMAQARATGSWTIALAAKATAMAQARAAGTWTAVLAGKAAAMAKALDTLTATAGLATLTGQAAAMSRAAGSMTLSVALAGQAAAASRARTAITFGLQLISGTTAGMARASGALSNVIAFAGQATGQARAQIGATIKTTLTGLVAGQSALRPNAAFFVGPAPTIGVDTHDGGHYVDHQPRHSKRVLGSLKKRREERLEERSALRRELEALVAPPEPVATRAVLPEPATWDLRVAAEPAKRAIVAPVRAAAVALPVARAHDIEDRIAVIGVELQRLSAQITAEYSKARRQREEEQIIMAVLAAAYDD